MSQTLLLLSHSSLSFDSFSVALHSTASLNSSSLLPGCLDCQATLLHHIAAPHHTTSQHYITLHRSTTSHYIAALHRCTTSHYIAALHRTTWRLSWPSHLYGRDSNLLIVSYRIVSYRIVLYCIASYCTILYYILYRIVLYFIAFSSLLHYSSPLRPSSGTMKTR